MTMEGETMTTMVVEVMMMTVKKEQRETQPGGGGEGDDTACHICRNVHFRSMPIFDFKAFIR